jgi:hypothetical protein
VGMPYFFFLSPVELFCRSGRKVSPRAGNTEFEMFLMSSMALSLVHFHYKNR